MVQEGLLALVRELGLLEGWLLLRDRHLLGFRLGFLVILEQVSSLLHLRKDASGELNWDHHWLLDLNGGWLNLSGGNIVLLDLGFNGIGLLLDSLFKVVLESLLQDFNSSLVVILLRDLQGLVVIFHLSLDSLELSKLSHVAEHNSYKEQWNHDTASWWMVSFMVSFLSLKLPWTFEVHFI